MRIRFVLTLLLPIILAELQFMQVTHPARARGFDEGQGTRSGKLGCAIQPLSVLLPC